MAKDEPDAQHKRILKVLFFTCNDPETQGTIQKGDAIEHEGHIWLVPIWLDSKTGAWSAPLRLVCLSAFPMGAQLQKLESHEEADFLLNYPIPISDFQKETPPETEHGFQVIEKPSLKIARPH